MAIVSNILNHNICKDHYTFDIDNIIRLSYLLDLYRFDINYNKVAFYITRQRNTQTKELLTRLENALINCEYYEWLSKRGIYDNMLSIDYNILSYQDKLDLYLYPEDYILDVFGDIIINGPAFVDYRNGELAGVCVRNITTDLALASTVKYTISNYGWFLYGYDLYSENDEIFIVEGVFDAIAMRKNGYNAIAIASVMPSAFQLGCLQYKFKNLNLCLDNDFWGRINSYIVSKATGIQSYLTLKKDPGEYINDTITLNKFDYTYDDLIDQIKEYEQLELKIRPLPYN
jgi:hypothetical protein